MASTGAILGIVGALGVLFGAVYVHWRLVGEARAASRETEDGFPPWIGFFYPAVLLGATLGGWAGSWLARRGRAPSA